MNKPKVYFIKDIKPENLVKLYDLLNANITGNVAIKLHSGEVGNQNFLHPDFFEPIVNHIKGTVVETNTAYPGGRNTTKLHKETLLKHGWYDFFDFELLDETEEVTIPIENGEVIKENIIGKNTLKYDSLVVLSHFKGHPMGGFGGALKQLSIGMASSNGKANIHCAGVCKDSNEIWNHIAPQDDFLKSMADAASSIVKHFDGHIAYISVLKNLSVDCDCISNADDPCMKDIGIVASLDPVAIDKACLDLVENSDDEGKATFLERVNSRNGYLTVYQANKLGIGSLEYELVEVK